MWTAQNMGKYWSVRNSYSWFIYIHCYTNMLWVLMIMQTSGGIPRRREHIWSAELTMDQRRSIWRSPKRLEEMLLWKRLATLLNILHHKMHSQNLKLLRGCTLRITAIDISLLSEYLSFYSAVCVLMMCCFWNGCGVFETSRKYPVMRW
jgi:hypothetical protein